jgi:hypothetical protein
VNTAKTNCFYLAMDTRTSTERLEDPLALWSAVSNLKIEALYYMWVGNKGRAVRRGPMGNTVRQAKDAIKL